MGIWDRANERDRHSAERAELRKMYDEVAADRDALVINNLRLGAERDEAIDLLRRAWPVIGTWSVDESVPNDVEAFLKRMGPATGGPVTPEMIAKWEDER